MKGKATFSAFILALGALGLLCVSGCGEESDQVPVYKVSGTVTYNGEPIEGAQVVFIPVEQGPAATGTTDSDGKYQLTTYAAEDGAPAGEYKVKITKMSKPPLESGPSGPAGGEEGYAPPGQEAMSWTPENLLPEKYAIPDQSGLTATVEANDNNTFAFELTD